MEEGEAEQHIEKWLYNLNEAPLPEEMKRKKQGKPILSGYSVEDEMALFNNLTPQQQGA